MDAQKSAAEDTFDFYSLPWVCQRRFVEICDPNTLKKFASINSHTRRLSKRCHYVEYARIQDDKPTQFVIPCYCNINERCDGYVLDQIKGKVDVIGTIDVWIYDEYIKTDYEFFQRLPVCLHSNQTLQLKLHHIEFAVLQKLLTPNLRKFRFYGRICFGYFVMEAIIFIERLSSLDDFTLEMYPSFHDIETDDFVSQVLNFLYRRVTVSVIGSKVVIKKRFLKSK